MGEGLVTIEDRDVTPGARYAYRIGLPVDGMETFSNEVWIEVPVALALAIDGVRPQPARGDVRVSFTLPNDSPRTAGSARRGRTARGRARSRGRRGRTTRDARERGAAQRRHLLRAGVAGRADRVRTRRPDRVIRIHAR